MTANSLIDLLTATWLGILGGCIGSFLNVVAYRLPRGMSVVWKPSHCPKCGRPIRWYDNVPVLGWLWLRGRCRDCHAPISPRYAIVEFVMATAFFALAYWEIFNGGANLPGGPHSPYTGALANLWDPWWPLLLWYAGHCLLLCVLMTAVLISLDSTRGKSRSLVLIAVWVLILFAVPFWQQLSNWFAG